LPPMNGQASSTLYFGAIRSVRQRENTMTQGRHNPVHEPIRFRLEAHHVIILLLTSIHLIAPIHAQYPDTTAMAKSIPQLIESGDIPGLSVAVVFNGPVAWSFSHGTLNDSIQTPVDQKTIFPAASLSKPVFAYIVMRLAARGEFDLDRPLSELLEYPRIAHDDRHTSITGRMVLSHGTGLPNWGGDRLNLSFDPGTGFNYSGEGFVYLQRVIETVTGLSLDQLARREVFEPLGMSRSRFVWQEQFEGNAVYGKDWAWRVEHLPRYSNPNAAFSLLTTAEDYGRFIAAMLNATGLEPASVEEMLHPVRSAHRPDRPSPVDDRVSWGLGWGLQENPGGIAFWHWGDNGPFKAFTIAYPGRGIGMVYFANAHDGLSIAEDIVSHLTDDEPLALRWLNYVRHDDPRRQLVKGLEDAAVNGGGDVMLQSYHTLRVTLESRLSIDESGRLAEFLNVHGLKNAAVRVLELAVEDYPDSARVYDRLAEVLLTTGAYQDAIAAHNRSLEIAPDNDNAPQRIEWIEQRIAAHEQPVSLSSEWLERCVGVYGPRRVRLEDGRLYYRREGNVEYPLTPLSEDLFALEGLETFRVRFDLEGTGPAQRIIGMYINGDTDENARSE
jgi:CubicO group peptidase (beta-lactamase class C family)